MQKTKSKKALRVGAILLGVLLVCAAAFLLYTADYYRAEEEALAVMTGETGVERRGKLTVLLPDYETDTGIVFYPGAKVEPEAYLPLLRQLRQEGVACVMAEMPFHMAIFAPDVALDAMAAVPAVEHWYIAGHSMGGAMASQFAAENSAAVEGLILLGAYPYGEYPLEDTLTVYGSLNTSVAEKITYTENVVVIEGGNHAQFGSYGPQKGDAEALITAEEQQRITVEAIGDFLADRG